MKDKKHKVRFWGETVGLSPFKVRFKQAMIAIKGDEDVPKSKFGLSSLKQLHPTISPYLWLGKSYLKNTVIISNLYNHTQTPIEEGWSVAKTQVRDFRGKKLTYNSHNGTDFSIPINSIVTASCTGKIVEVHSEFNRGGLKIYIDHGCGLMTTYAHLARALVKVGDMIEAGEPIAISGYSGLDSLISIPWGIPHVHFNVWLNGEPIDPFPFETNSSLWFHDELPKGKNDDTKVNFTPSVFNSNIVHEIIETCKTKSVKERLLNIESIYEKAHQLIIAMNYYPTRFPVRKNIYTENYKREKRLFLPFRYTDFFNIVFLDEI